MKNQSTQTALFCSSRRFAGFSVMGGIGFFAAMKELSNYPGYAINEVGEVFSLSRKVRTRRGGFRTVPPRKLKPTLHNRGYLLVSLWREGRGKFRYIHQLMAEAFLGLTGEYHVDHIDGNKKNNHLTNLRLATRSQNSQNSKAHSDSQSGLKGVSRKRKRWRARIVVDGKEKSLGVFGTKEEAHAAWVAVAKELHGEFFRVA